MTVLLLVVLECHDVWNTALKKIRFTSDQLKHLAQRDNNMSRNLCESVEEACTGRLVTMGIMEWVAAELERPVDDRFDEEEDGGFRLELYCPTQRTFVSLLKCNIPQTFGSRVRCSLVLSPNYRRSSDSSSSHPSPPLAIMGRWFDYDPNGMMVLGKPLVVKEVLNHKVDGTFRKVM